MSLCLQCYVQKAGRSKRWSIILGMRQEKAKCIITISWMLGKQALWPKNVCSVKFKTNNSLCILYIIHCSYFAPILDSVFEVL